MFLFFIYFTGDNMKYSKVISYINKFLFTVLLTVVTLIVLKANTKLKAPFYKHVYEDNISFAEVNKLYKKYLGSQIPFSDLLKTKTVFNEILKYKSKEKYNDGVLLNVDSNYLVPSLEEGMVVFVGEKEKYGKTVIVSGTNGVDIWYSNVNSNVKLYDYINKSSIIGEAIDKKIYLVFKKDNKILNYEDYI